MQAHQERCFDRHAPLPISARGLGQLPQGRELSQTKLVPAVEMSFGASSSAMANLEPPSGQRINLDVSDGLAQGIFNKNALEK